MGSKQISVLLSCYIGSLYSNWDSIKIKKNVGGICSKVKFISTCTSYIFSHRFNPSCGKGAEFLFNSYIAVVSELSSKCITQGCGNSKILY